MSSNSHGRVMWEHETSDVLVKHAEQHHINSILKLASDDGWELVAVVQVNPRESHGGSTILRHYFKRQARAGDPPPDPGAQRAGDPPPDHG